MSLDELLSTFDRKKAAPAAELESFVQTFRFEPPADYLDFLRGSNGGEGFIGGRYFMATPLEDLQRTNELYQISRFAPGLFLFGSSGGGEGYAFDLRSTRPTIVAVPFVTLSLNELSPMGSTFEEFLERLVHDE